MSKKRQLSGEEGAARAVPATSTPAESAERKSKKSRKSEGSKGPEKDESHANPKETKQEGKGKRHKEGKKSARSGNSLDAKLANGPAFDSELNDIFSAAASSAPPAPKKKPSKQTAAASSVPVKEKEPVAKGEEAPNEELIDSDSGEQEDEEADEHTVDDDEELPSESDEEMVAALKELDEMDDEEVQVDEEEEETADDSSDDDDDEAGEDTTPAGTGAAIDIDALIQSSIIDSETGSREGKGKGKEKEKERGAMTPEEQAEQDGRTIFVGNVPVEAVTSRSIRNALKTHLASQLPSLSRSALTAMRFRSIPFSAPTASLELSNARTATEAAAIERRQARSLAHREALAGAEAEERGLPANSVQFLRPSQKRKVAFIKQDLNEKASSVNAYITISSSVGAGDKVQKSSGNVKSDAGDEKDSDDGEEPEDGSELKAMESLGKVSAARAVASALAARADASVFMERHLRVDLAVAFTADEANSAIAALQQRMALASKVAKKGEGSAPEPILPELSDLQLIELLKEAEDNAGFDHKRTVFVGNLDFSGTDEALRAFFESLLIDERGPCTTSNSESSTAGSAGWVRSVRIIRDRATQMGKGFGYVRFIDEACVDEVMAIHEAEEAFLNAAEQAASGKKGATGGQGRVKKMLQDENGKKVNFKRKLKFMGRPIRVSRCKAKTKGSFGGERGPRRNPSGFSSSPLRDSPRGADAGKSTPASRRRSTGAPTPGGTSPFTKSQPRNGGPMNNIGSPVNKRNTRDEGTMARGGGVGIIPGNALNTTSEEYRNLDKSARVALKKSDADRQERRMEKKRQKLATRKASSKNGGVGVEGEKVKLKQGKASKKSKPGMGGGSKMRKDKKEKKKKSSSS